MYRLFEGGFYRIYMIGGLRFNHKYHWLYIAVGDLSMIRTGKRSGRWTLVDVSYIATRTPIRKNSNRYIDTWLRILGRWYGT